MTRLPDPSDAQAWLDAAYELLASADCNGCPRCSAKCAGAIQVWLEEYLALRVAAEAAGLDWPPPQPEGEWERCPFLDARAFCAVYSARPFICRAFGLVPWLPCTTEEVEPIEVTRALSLFGDYASRPRKTLAQWSCEEPS